MILTNKKFIFRTLSLETVQHVINGRSKFHFDVYISCTPYRLYYMVMLKILLSLQSEVVITLIKDLKQGSFRI